MLSGPGHILGCVFDLAVDFERFLVAGLNRESPAFAVAGSLFLKDEGSAWLERFKRHRQGPIGVEWNAASITLGPVAKRTEGNERGLTMTGNLQGEVARQRPVGTKRE